MKVIFWLKTPSSATGYVEEHFASEDLDFLGDFWSKATGAEKHQIVQDWMTKYIEFGFEELA